MAGKNPKLRPKKFLSLKRFNRSQTPLQAAPKSPLDENIAAIDGINEALVKFGQTPDVDNLLKVVSHKITNLMSVPSVLIYIRDEKTGVFNCRGAAGKLTAGMRGLELTSKDLIFEEIASLKETIILSTRELAALFPSISKKVKACEALFVPLLRGDSLTGVICCFRKDSFGGADLKVMNMISRQVSVWLENAVLQEKVSTKSAELAKFHIWFKKSRRAFINILEDVNQASAQLEKALHQTLSMYRIAVELSKSLDESRLLKTILSNSAGLVGAKKGTLVISAGLKLKQETNFNFDGDLQLDSPQTPIYWVNTNKKPIIINNFGRTSYKKYQRLIGIKNLVAVPLVQRERCLGVLSLFDKEGGFSRIDCQNLVTLAHQATVTLLNARIHENERRTVAKLKELNKMKADFVASVSHELRNPLTTVKGYLDLISEGEAGPVTKQQLNYLDIIDESSGRLLNLINDLLTLSKIESASLKMNKRQISLNDVLTEIAKIMEPEAKQKGVRLLVRLGKDLPLIEADSDRLDQVVINLVSNAIKFTPKGGAIEICSEDKSDALVASVKDTGPGIRLKDQKRLFDKFFRSQQTIVQNVKGTGLGLAIAKGIIDQHQGKIWVQSEPDKGSTFYFSLPIKKKSAA